MDLNVTNILFITIIWTTLLIFPLIFSDIFSKIQIVYGVFIGIMATITSKEFHDWLNRPIIDLLKPTFFFAQKHNGEYFHIPIKNKGKSMLKNCSVHLSLFNHSKKGVLFISTNLPWSPNRQATTTDINIDQVVNLDVCFVDQKYQELRFPVETGYGNGFIEYRLQTDQGIKEVGQSLSLTKHVGEKFEGSVRVTAANTNPISRKIKLEIINSGIKLSLIK